MVRADTVTVTALNPTHEHALEYRAKPEQNEAYAGIVGVRVTARSLTGTVKVITDVGEAVKVDVTVDVLRFS